jgi:hypothetical protein
MKEIIEKLGKDFPGHNFLIINDMIHIDGKIIRISYDYEATLNDFHSVDLQEAFYDSIKYEINKIIN